MGRPSTRRLTCSAAARPAWISNHPSLYIHSRPVQFPHFRRTYCFGFMNRRVVRYLAKQPRLICGRRPSDAHQLRFAQSPALGSKVSDEFTAPLCRCHQSAASSMPPSLQGVRRYAYRCVLNSCQSVHNLDGVIGLRACGISEDFGCCASG
jgi:hypothetical protein